MTPPPTTDHRSSARVLIAGCGDVGTALGLLLHDRGGHEVWGLRRRASALPAAIRPIAADLGDPPTLAGLPAGLDYVVYAAAADGHSESAYRRAYADGVAALLSALAEQGQSPHRIFFTSSTGVYGQTAGEWVDESSPTEPESWTGRILLEAERRLLAGPFPATVVRLGGIYGPGRTRLIRLVQSGEATYARDQPAYTNRIHRDDCAGAIAHLLAMDLARTPPEEVYVGVDCEPAERRVVLTWLAERLGVEPPRAVEPGPGGRGGNKRCRNARLLAAGYRFRYPTFREGYGAMLADHAS